MTSILWGLRLGTSLCCVPTRVDEFAPPVAAAVLCTKPILFKNSERRWMRYSCRPSPISAPSHCLVLTWQNSDTHRRVPPTAMV